MARILVAYASKKGSTAEIAEAIGRELRAAGSDVDIAEVGTVTSLAGYHGVVIGGPVYMGRILRDVQKFSLKYAAPLGKMPVAAFAVGLAPVSGGPSAVGTVESSLRSSVSPLQPVAVTVFAGRLDPATLSWLQRKMTEKVKSPVGDFRDWNAIAAWARELPGRMGL